MSGLYPNYKPIGVKQEWDHCSMETVGSGEVMRRHGVMADYGNPVDAVAWFDVESGSLRLLVADYANGRRATLRKRRNGSSLEIVTPERATPHQHGAGNGEKHGG